jgi:hypothetical protein
MRVVEKPFPPCRGSRFFKVDPHHKKEALFHLRGEFFELAGIFQSGSRVVDRTRA